MPILYVVFSIIFCLLGLGIGYYIRGLLGKKRQDLAEMKAREIEEQARKEAEDRKKELELQAKDELYKLRSELDKEYQEQKGELKRYEKRLITKEENIDNKVEIIEKKEKDISNQKKGVESRKKELDERENQLSKLEDEQKRVLSRLSGLSPQQAKEALLSRMRDEAKYEAALMIRRIEEQARETADKRARDIISQAIQRCAADHVVESTVTVVPLPDDEMKGRIIGREGRNIRALETETGIDLIIDDTPGAVILSGFDPIRREIARIALERLIADGRIHTARIEQVVEKAREEMDQIIREEGERTALDVDVHGLHPEEIRLLGTLAYRTSYGQNVLQHSKEVALLAGMMAAELHENEKLARRIGLLHDIGKSVDHEVEGTHASIGAELARKYDESGKVIHAIEAHHGEVVPHTVLAVLIQAADALSAARPGARRETLESYVKRLQKLEEVADSFDGVDKTYAIQAGREIRVILRHEEVDDLGASQLARDIAKKLEEEMEYPGQIKVTAIRETRAVEYAR
ncbi:ribonuclease Y [Candidatus Poribacteria bacterium]|nr:ribonuclease Y [Candidatus Poribacteria bacterium]